MRHPISDKLLDEWLENKGYEDDREKLNALLKHIAWMLNDPPALQAFRDALQRMAKKKATS